MPLRVAFSNFFQVPARRLSGLGESQVIFVDRWPRRDRDRVGGGLLIPGCRSIHTFGMRFAIDVAFLDAEGAVLSRRLELPRRRVVADRRASAVLEVPTERRR